MHSQASGVISLPPPRTYLAMSECGAPDLLARANVCCFSCFGGKQLHGGFSHPTNSHTYSKLPAMSVHFRILSPLLHPLLSSVVHNQAIEKNTLCTM